MALRRSRAIAIAVVLCAALASIARGDLIVTTNPTDAGIGSAGSIMHAVFSVRNTSTVDVDASFTAPLTPMCTGKALTTIDGQTAQTYMIPGREQRQFVITFNATISKTCPWSITVPNMTDTPFDDVFVVSGANQQQVNVQPARFDFTVSGASES